MENRGLASLSERRLLARGVPVRPLVHEAHPYPALLDPVLIGDSACWFVCGPPRLR